MQRGLPLLGFYCFQDVFHQRWRVFILAASRGTWPVEGLKHDDSLFWLHIDVLFSCQKGESIHQGLSLFGVLKAGRGQQEIPAHQPHDVKVQGGSEEDQTGSSNANLGSKPKIEKTLIYFNHRKDILYAAEEEPNQCSGYEENEKAGRKPFLVFVAAGFFLPKIDGIFYNYLSFFAGADRSNILFGRHCKLTEFVHCLLERITALNNCFCIGADPSRILLHYVRNVVYTGLDFTKSLDGNRNFILFTIYFVEKPLKALHIAYKSSHLCIGPGHRVLLCFVKRFELSMSSLEIGNTERHCLVGVFGRRDPARRCGALARTNATTEFDRVSCCAGSICRGWRVLGGSIARLVLLVRVFLVAHGGLSISSAPTTIVVWPPLARMS